MKPHNTYPFLDILPELLHEHLPELLPKQLPELLPKPSPEVLPEVLPKPMEISMLESDWLAYYHPIPNAKCPPITALLNRSTYHKCTNGSPPPCTQILWAPQINEKADSK